MAWKRRDQTEVRGSGARLIDAFDTRDRRRALEPGHVLAREGEEADEVFVVLDGTLEVAVDDRETSGKPTLKLATLGAGDLAGEITVVAGGRRTATLTASSAANVLAIGRDSFEEWLLDHPDEMGDLIGRARDRLDRTLVARILSDLVGELADDPAMTSLVERLELTRLEAGEQLFTQGDVSDAAYVVVSGRLRVDREGQTPTMLGEVGRGDVVGEMGLLDDAPRSASIRAVRDSTLARLSLEQFRSLMMEKPQMILHFARTVLRRTVDRQDRAERATSVAVVIATRDAGSFLDDLTTEIASLGSTLRLSAARVDEILERPGFAASASADSGLPRLSEYLHEMEGRHDHLVYEIDSTDSYWGQLAIRQADRVVVIVSPEPDAGENVSLAAVSDRLAALPDIPVWHVVVESPGTTIPSSAADLRRRHQPSELMHVRRNHEGDAARVARLVIDRGIGLVLSGGGARGFAHIGVIRAMAERGVAIDRVGGASIGSVLAGAVALGLDHDEMETACTDIFRRLMDFTIPFVSLVRGRRISNALAEFFDGWSIGDTWVPFYCVSSDLTMGELYVHQEGGLADAIRASIAIPGMLPPIAKDGRLLVDGGVLDNLPVDTMRAQAGISRVVAVDVAQVEGPAALEDYGPSVSAAQVVKARLARGPSPYPGLPGVLVRSMLVGAVRDRNRVMESGAIDLYIDIDMPEFGLLEFDKVGPIVERGYRAGIDAVDGWLERG